MYKATELLQVQLWHCGVHACTGVLVVCGPAPSFVLQFYASHHNAAMHSHGIPEGPGWCARQGLHDPSGRGLDRTRAWMGDGCAANAAGCWLPVRLEVQSCSSSISSLPGCSSGDRLVGWWGLPGDPCMGSGEGLGVCEPQPQGGLAASHAASCGMGSGLVSHGL